MGKPLGIPLGIDFQKLDSDLNKVADRIESVGKSASIKLGSGTRDVASGNIDPDKLGSAVESVGTRLSAGVANGIRGASALMLGFSASINAMLNKLVGSTITMFQRIDAAMKFPVMASFFQGIQAKASNMSALVSKPMTDVDKAVGGQFGSMVSKIARVFKVLFAELAASIASSMTNAIGPVVAQLSKVSEKFVEIGGNVKATEASASLLYQNVDKIAAAAQKAAAAGEGLKTSFKGPKIGAGTDSTAPPADTRTPAMGMGDVGRGPVNTGLKAAMGEVRQFNAEIKAAGGYINVASAAMGPWGTLLRAPAAAVQYLWQGLGIVESGTKKVLGAIVSLGLRGGLAIARVTNFFSAMGNVGKMSYSEIYQKHGVLYGSILSMTKAVGGMFGMFRSGSAGATAAMGTTKTSVGQLSGAVSSMGRQLLVAFGIVGIAFKVVQFFKGGIEGAAKLNDTVNASKGIFGDSFGEIGAQANSISKKYGVMREEQIKIASGFGAMAQGAGMTEKASATLANKMTMLTLDFAKTWDIPFTEAAEHVRGGLKGMGRGLKDYGVWIDDATVKSNAMADGMATVAARTTRASHSVSGSMKKMPKGFSSVETPGKTSGGGGGGAAPKIVVDKDVGLMERAKIIMEGLSYTQGALERTSAGASAQFRKAGGGIGEFAVRIGELLLPAVQMGTEAFNTLLSALIDVFETHQDTIKGWVSYITDGMKKVAFVARNLGNVWEIVKLRIGEFVINSVAQIQALADNWEPIWEWLKKNWVGLLEDMMANFLQFGKNLGTVGLELGKALWSALSTGEFKFDFKLGDLMKDFQRTTDALPDMIEPKLISVSDRVNEIWGDIQKQEDKIKTTPFGPPPKKPGEAKEPGKAAEYKLAGAVEIGSKEASSILTKSAMLARGGDTGTKTVSLLGQSVQVQKDLLSEQRKKKPEFKVAT